MGDVPPLSSLEPFTDLAEALPWGPDGRWRATFGGHVVDELANGIRQHPAAVSKRFPLKAEAYPLVLGCVPWFTSEVVADALLDVGHFCVVVNKGSWSGQLQRLLDEGFGVQQTRIPGLEYWAPPESGRPPVVTPGWRPDEDRMLEPVRALGWRRAGEHSLPLLHAKVAVCCAAYSWEGPVGGWENYLQPMSVWIGSANWTERSRWHLEFGAWTTDEALARGALDLVTAAIKVSEPPGSILERPTPELVAAEWDDNAFADYVAELGDESEAEPDGDPEP